MTAPRPVDARPGRLLERLEPFVVAPSWRHEALDMHPLGTRVAPADRYDPLTIGAARFLDRLVRLDRLAFGPEGMPMPEWLFVDGSALPGVIAGLGMRAGEIPDATLARLGFDARSHELVPLAMYIAVPVRPPAVWYGHNLASLNRQAPELGLAGLGGVTKALGLRVMRCAEQIGATQWASPALHVHTRFGPLELLTAWTPAHGNPATLTYRLRVTEEGIANVLEGRPPQPARGDLLWISPAISSTVIGLETRLERGDRYAIVGAPERDADGRSWVPLACISRRAAMSAAGPARCAAGSRPGRAPPSAARRSLPR